MNIVVEGIEYVEAPLVRYSKEIEYRFKNNADRFGLPENFLEDMTGVKTRREWDKSVSVADIAYMSAIKLIDKLGINRDEIGVIINASVSRDYVEPTISVIVHDKLKLSDRCLNFDINNACMGFANALHIVHSLLKTKQIKYGLIICGESSQRVLDLTTDRLKRPEITFEKFILELATLTLGSGSVSMLMCREEDSKGDGHTIEEQMFSTDSKHNMLCKGDHSQMICDSHNMLKEGIFLVNKTWDICNKEFLIWGEAIERYVPHQVSTTHSKVLSKYTGVPLEKMELIFPYLGNTGPSAWPIGLYIADQAKRINKGSYVGVLSMGSGFNCSCIRIKW